MFESLDRAFYLTSIRFEFLISFLASIYVLYEARPESESSELMTLKEIFFNKVGRISKDKFLLVECALVCLSRLKTVVEVPF